MPSFIRSHLYGVSLTRMPEFTLTSYAVVLFRNDPGLCDLKQVVDIWQRVWDGRCISKGQDLISPSQSPTFQLFNFFRIKHL